MSIASPLGRRKKPSLTTYVVKFPAGEKIYLEGEIGTEMYAIRSGEVEITKTFQGQPRPLTLLRRGDFFGEMSLLDDLPREETAKARTDVVLVRVNGTTLDAMLKTNAEVAVRMMRRLSRRSREAEGARGHEPRRRPAGDPPSRSDLPRRHEPSADQGEALFELVSTDRATRFPVREGDTIIGRGDPVTGSTADVDLAGLDPERSVSRRHARLYRIGETEYLMEEIGVINGTFVNNVKLATGVPAAVRHGDLLRFGLVTLTFWKPA